MYVVKRLAGVQAVQTLSRLNRIAPGKARTFVLDFANEQADIYEAFKPYYETTPIGENADPHHLSELQHKLLEWAIFTPTDVMAFAVVWYRHTRDHTASQHKIMNSVLDAVVEKFKEKEEVEQETFRGQLTAYRNLYAFLSQIIPYQDSELEKFYAFVRNLLLKLPPPGDGKAFALDDEVALRYFRLQQMSDGSIDLGYGQADPLKGPTDIGTAGLADEGVALSTLVGKLNERFGTSFTEADQLFFDQISASAEVDEKILEAARANNLANFSSYLERMLDELFIDRMEGNEEIFSRVMTDKEFRSVAHEHLAREIFKRAREKNS
jgi:type I restriction enzyme R subunit